MGLVGLLLFRRDRKMGMTIERDDPVFPDGTEGCSYACERFKCSPTHFLHVFKPQQQTEKNPIPFIYTSGTFPLPISFQNI